MLDRSSPQLRAVVVDPRRLVREGVRALLSSHPALLVSDAADASTGGSADVLVLGDVCGRDSVPSGIPVVWVAEIEDVDELADAVVRAAQEPATERAVARRAPSSDLTSRERTVMHLVGRGHSAVEIGRELGISPRTVERHKQSLVAKLGAPNQANAVVRSLAHGLLGEAG